MLKIYLPIKAISLNSATATLRNGRRVNSKEYNIFKRDANHFLDSYMKQLAEFARLFDHVRHGVVTSYTFGMPNLFRKKGGINLTSTDCSNITKCIEDVVFGKFKLFNKKLDDGAVIFLTSKKIPHDEFGISIKMELVNLDEYYSEFSNKTSPEAN